MIRLLHNSLNNWRCNIIYKEVVMRGINRKSISSALLLGLILSSAVATTNANAFPFGKKNTQKQSEMKQSEIQTPRQEPIAASDANVQAPKFDTRPATREERERAKSSDLVAQSTFWLNELAKNEKDTEAAIYGSNALLGIGSNQRAMEVAAAGIQSDANNAQLWKNLGISLYGLNRSPDAITALTKATSLNPSDIEIKNALGSAYDDMGQSSMAIKTFTEALAINPNSAVTLTNLGLSQALGGDLKTAEATLRKAQSIQFAPIQARQNLALIVALQGRFQEAEQIASMDLPDAVAKQNMAYVRSMLDEGDVRRNTIN